MVLIFLCRPTIQFLYLTVSSTERFILKRQPDMVINSDSIKYGINLLKPTNYVMHQQV